MTLHRPLLGTISRFFRRNGTKAVLLRILLSHRNFLFLFLFSSNVLKLRNRDNEPKRSRLKPVNEKDENTKTRVLWSSTFVITGLQTAPVLLLLLFFFFCFLCGRLVVTRWRSRFGIALKINFFRPVRRIVKIAFSSLQPLITNYYPALTKLDFGEFNKKKAL